SAVPSSVIAALKLAGGSSSRAGPAAAPSAARCSPPSAHVHTGGVGRKSCSPTQMSGPPGEQGSGGDSRRAPRVSAAAADAGGSTLESWPATCGGKRRGEGQWIVTEACWTVTSSCTTLVIWTA